VRGENISSYLRLMGEPATWTHNGVAESVRALYQAPGASELGGDVIVTRSSALLCAADVPGIKRGDSLAINGTTWTIGERMPLDDGAFILTELS
jgi:hypothetical protein